MENCCLASPIIDSLFPLPFQFVNLSKNTVRLNSSALLLSWCIEVTSDSIWVFFFLWLFKLLWPSSNSQVNFPCSSGDTTRFVLNVSPMNVCNVWCSGSSWDWWAGGPWWRAPSHSCRAGWGLGSGHSTPLSCQQRQHPSAQKQTYWWLLVKRFSRFVWQKKSEFLSDLGLSGSRSSQNIQDIFRISFGY